MQAKRKCLKSHAMELSKCFEEFTITIAIVFLSMNDISGHEISIFSISRVLITFIVEKMSLVFMYNDF